MALGEVCEHGSLKRQCLICELQAENKILREAVEATDIYFKALCEQWAANNGRVVSDSGTVINAGADVERLCEVAASKVGQIVNGWK